MDDCTLTNLEPSVVILLHNSTLNCLLDFIAKLMDDVGEKVMYSEIWPKVSWYINIWADQTTSIATFIGNSLHNFVFLKCHVLNIYLEKYRASTAPQRMLWENFPWKSHKRSTSRIVYQTQPNTTRKKKKTENHRVILFTRSKLTVNVITDKFIASSLLEHFANCAPASYDRIRLFWAFLIT